MAGVYKLEIRECEADLKTLLDRQKTASAKERVFLLYLLKREQVKSVTEAANLLGRHRVTLERWLGKYRQGGISQLLSPRPSGGRKRQIRGEADQKLQARLQQGDGFDSYIEIQQWLSQTCGVEVSYPVVHRHVRYRLKAKLKVPRPISRDQNAEQVAAFKKTWLPN
jgi:transposase